MRQPRAISIDRTLDSEPACAPHWSNNMASKALSIISVSIARMHFKKTRVVRRLWHRYSGLCWLVALEKSCAPQTVGEVVNSMEERILVSMALRKSTARSSRSRGREQTVISLLLRNSEMRLTQRSLPTASNAHGMHSFIHILPQNCHREFSVFEWA